MKENGLKRRLTVIISYVFIVPSLVVFYILFEQQVALSTRNVILYLLIAALAIIGIVLVHYVFDAISTIAAFLKKASEGGEKLSLSLQQEAEELNEITASFYMKMPITTCYKKTFIVDNQLDRDFYIRGRHEGADNSLCKS